MKTPELCLAAGEKALMVFQYVDDQRPLTSAVGILARPLTVGYMCKDAFYLADFPRLAMRMDPRAKFYLKKRVKEKEVA